MFDFKFSEVLVTLITTIAFMFLLQPCIPNIVGCGVLSALMPFTCFVLYKAVFRKLISKRWQKYVVIAVEFLIIFSLVFLFRFVN